MTARQPTPEQWRQRTHMFAALAAHEAVQPLPPAEPAGRHRAAPGRRSFAWIGRQP